MKKLRDILYEGYEHTLLKEVLKGPIPQHVAIIMDGNRRYAAKKGEALEKGHADGAETTRKVLRWCRSIGVKQSTVYAFSTENFKRTEEEKAHIFHIIGNKLEEITIDEEVYQNRLRIRAIGNVTNLPKYLRRAINYAEDNTKENDMFYFNVAVAYGGREEIVDAARQIAMKVKLGELEPEDITPEIVNLHLYTCNQPQLSDVDLIIRTGGESRTSNFLPWQANGNECAAYFCAPYWPEFRKIDLLRAIMTYQHRVSEERQHIIKRGVMLLGEYGKIEVEEILNLPVKLAKYTRREAIKTINELSKSKMDPQEIVADKN